jgi:outer membrane protein OmpA-like peptidoglycan-associated protein
MSTISYGDTLPVASNKTKKGRAENRRVVVVVMQ